jgi:hypothetical protein
MMRKLWAVARVAVGAALLYYVFSRADNWTALKQLLSSAWLLPLLGAQALCGNAIEALRLRVLFRSQRIAVPFGYGFQLCSISSFFNLCIPGGTGGDLLKFYYLRERHGRTLEIATVLLIDRIVAMFALLGLILALAVAEGSLIRHYAIIRVLIFCVAALMVALPAAALVSCSSRMGLARWLARNRHMARVVGAVHAFRDHKGALAAAAGVSLAGHLLLAAMFAITGSVVLPHAPALVVCVLALLGMFANLVPITPGGLGVGESAFQALFAVAGFSAGAPLMLAFRAGMAFPSLIGCALYARGIRQPRYARTKGQAA